MNYNSDIKTISRGILRYLESQKKIHLLPQIAKQLLADSESLGRVTVRSSRPLVAGYRRKIANLIKLTFGLSEIDFLTDPKILGGLKITSGDKILDLSLNAKLDNLVESLSL